MNKQITSIQVLGSGCPTCKKLFELTKKAAAELNLKVEVEYTTDIQKIIALGVMSSPVLTVNGQTMLAGSLPDLKKIKEIILSAHKYADDDMIDSCASCARG
ncbi:MAG: thioredoxin family protein [Patescibacteria group bacterium]|jgi:small redox-active disulfide protein 2